MENKKEKVFNIERDGQYLKTTDEHGDTIVIDKYESHDDTIRFSIEDGENIFDPSEGGFQFDFSLEEFRKFIDGLEELYKEAVEVDAV